MEQYNEGFQHEEASPEHHSATSSEHGMSAFGDTASISVGEVGDVSKCCIAENNKILRLVSIICKALIIG